MRKGLAIFGLGFATGRMAEEPKVAVVRKVAYLGAGMVIGYTAAMDSQEQAGELREVTVDFLRTLKAIANDAWLDVKKEMDDAKKAATATPEDIIGDRTTEKPPDNEPVADSDDKEQPHGEPL